MNREEALEKTAYFNSISDEAIGKVLVNEIYDHFEAREVEVRQEAQKQISEVRVESEKIKLPIYRGQIVNTKDFTVGSLIDYTKMREGFKIEEIRNISGFDKEGIQKTNNWDNYKHKVYKKSIEISLDDGTTWNFLFKE